MTAIVAPEVLCYGPIEVVNHVQTPRLPTLERASDVTADYYRAGGAAVNGALALAAWGVRSALAGNDLGEDAYADLILRELERHPLVERRWVRRLGQVRTPFSRIFVMPDRERYIVRYWHNEAVWREPQPDMLAGVRYLSTTSEAGKAAVQAAQLARSQGLTVVASDVVRPEHPLAGLSDRVVTSMRFLHRHLPDFEPAQLPALAAAMLEAGVKQLIVTDGSRPVLVFGPDGRGREYPSFPLPPVDRTGAGDVFQAACIFGLLQGWDEERYVRFAAAAAALWIGQPSPLKRPPTVAEIETLLAERMPSWQVVAPEVSAQHRVCPLCRRWVAAALFDKHREMEPEVVAAIAHSYPGWRRADGACPRCVHEFKALAAARQPVDVPLLLPGHPIYGRPDLFVLPTPVRLRANPHYTGRGITIAFLDSGFYPHPDLTQPVNRIAATVDATTTAIVEGADFREPQPVSWHGLMTSAVAAGNGTLSQGRYAGIASEAQVVLVKISDPQGRIRERDIARGLRWVAANHRRFDIRIVNLSVGGDRSGLNRRSLVDRLVAELVRRGVIVVAAAGNSGQPDLFPPASAPEAITVGGSDDQNVLDPQRQRIYKSNWARLPSGRLKPEVLAPGIWLAAPVLPGTRIAEQNLILDRLWRAHDEELPALLASTWSILDLPSDLPTASLARQREAIQAKMVANKFITAYYQHVDGTSFAAPIVSSVIAQMLEANPRLAPERVKELLIATAMRLPHEPHERQGFGVVTPGRAVAAALREGFGALTEAPLSPWCDEEGIHLVYYDRRARRVAVVGDFNDWDPQAHPMHIIRPWQWRLTLPSLPPGRYHYKFLIDDEVWVDDPENVEKEADGYGGFNAVLVVNENR